MIKRNKKYLKLTQKYRKLIREKLEFIYLSNDLDYKNFSFNLVFNTVVKYYGYNIFISIRNVVKDKIKKNNLEKYNELFG